MLAFFLALFLQSVVYTQDGVCKFENSDSCNVELKTYRKVEHFAVYVAAPFTLTPVRIGNEAAGDEILRFTIVVGHRTSSALRWHLIETSVDSPPPPPEETLQPMKRLPPPSRLARWLRHLVFWR